MPTPHHRRTTLWLLFGSCLGGGLTCQGQEGPRVIVETVTSEVIGDLLSLDAQRGVELSGDNNVRLPPEDVLTVRFDREYRPADDPRDQPDTRGTIQLVDGSRFAYRSVDFLADRLRFTLPSGGTLETPTNQLAEWRRNADDSAAPEIADPGEAADFLFVRRANGETVPVGGVVLDLSKDGVRFALETNSTADPVSAPWSRVAGIRFYRSPPSEMPPTRPVITLVSGASLVAEAVSYSRGRLAWRGAGGRGACPIAAAAALDLSAGRVVPVRRLELIGQRWKPFFEDAEPRALGFAFDASLAGESLALRWPDRRASDAWPAVKLVRPYDHGVAIRSESELQFALPEGSRRIKGWIGLNPRTAGVGSAEVAVLAGDTLLWSGMIDGGTRPVELNSALPAAPVLTLRVGYGDNLDAGDNVHFAELRVVQ